MPRIRISAGVIVVAVLLVADDARASGADYYGDPLPAGAIARLGTARFRCGYVPSLTFFPDGKVLALVSGGRPVFFSIPDGKRLEKIGSGPRRFTDLACSPDGKTLATVGENKIALWDLRTGKLVREFRGRGGQLTFSPDGKLLASCADARTGDRAIDLYDLVAARERFRLLWHEDAVHTLAFTADSRHLISGSDDKTIRFWEVGTGQELGKITNNSLPGQQGMALAPDGKTLAGSSDNGIRIWDVSSRKLVREIAGFRPQRLLFAGDGKILASANYDTLALWDVASGKEIRKLRMSVSASWPALAFSPDGKLLAYVRDSAIRLMNVASGQELPRLQGHENELLSVAFNPSGKTVVSGDWGGGACVWDSETGRALKVLSGHRGYIRSAVFSPDGRSIISGAGDNSVRIWEAASGKEMRRFLLDAKVGAANGYRGRRVVAMRLAPDGNTLITQSTGEGPSQGESSYFQLWNLASGKEIWQKEHDASLPVAFSPDGRGFLSTRGNAIQLRELTGGRLLAECPTADSTVYPFGFSRDSAVLAGTTFQYEKGRGYRSAPRYRLHLWELASGKECLSFPLDLPPTGSVAFAPNDTMLALGAHDNSIRLINVADGKELLRLAGHALPALCLAFAPDGQRLVTGHKDGTVHVWDLRLSLRAGLSPRRLQEEELERCWTALAGDDAAKAHEAIWKLIAAPEQALAIFRSRLTPAAFTDKQRLQQLLADLDSNQFKTREIASRELAKMGAFAETALRRRLADQPSGEVRRRIEKLLAAPVPPAAGECLRRLRAVRVLEQLGSEQARSLLTVLADGADGARETQAARAALQRLQGKP
jgi:WD40 repeat protein